MAHQTTRTTLMEMFVDNTAGESTHRNRLTTEETESGNVALVAYGWLKLAEYTESRNAVTVFTGHQALNSRTVSRWLNEVVNVAQDRSRDVILSGESPTEDQPNTGARYINNYISFSDRSAVENDVLTEVRESFPSDP